MQTSASLFMSLDLSLDASADVCMCMFSWKSLPESVCEVRALSSHVFWLDKDTSGNWFSLYCR